MSKFIMALVLFGTLAGCSTTGTGADFDENVDFSKYKSFDWLPKEEWKKPDAMAQNERVAREIANAIADNLTRRGFRHLADEPDLHVTFLTGVRDNMGQTQWGYGYGGQEKHGGWIPTSNYREGRLLIDILDAKSGAMIWRGWAEDEVGGYEDAMARLRNIVDKVLAQFPPPAPQPDQEKP
jgi:hypothetical protein